MSDLAQGAHAKLILNPGDVYRVSTAGSASVAVAYGAPAGTTTVTNTTQDFGPYQAPAKLILTAGSGGASYRLLGVDAANGGGPASALTAAQVARAQNLGKPIQITGATVLAQLIHDGANLILPAAGVGITLNDGLGQGYGNLFVGPVTISGTATLVDKRKSGDAAADAISTLVQQGQVGDTVRGAALTHDLYWLQGGKA